MIQVAGDPEAGPAPERNADRAVEITTWGATHRRAEVGAGEESLLFLPENFNPGWVASVDGKNLTSLRVDGWQQGWLLPASDEPVEVDIDYRPQRTYATVLTAGLGSSGLLLLAGCVLLLATVLMRGRRRPQPAPDWPGAPGAMGWRVFVLALLVALVLLGPVPAVGLLVGFVLPARLVGPAVMSSAGLIFGGTVVDVVLTSSLSGRVSDVVTALAAGVMAGISLRGRR